MDKNDTGPQTSTVRGAKAGLGFDSPARPRLRSFLRQGEFPLAKRREVPREEHSIAPFVLWILAFLVFFCVGAVLNR
jgi:hypothetical protein